MAAASPDKPAGVLVLWNSKILQRCDMDVPSYLPLVLEGSGINTPQWIPLPLTDRTGLPLRYMVMDLGEYWFPGLADLNGTPFNQTVATLSTDVDPTSVNFGKATIQTRADVMLSRADGGDLVGEHVQAVEAFVRARLAAAKGLVTSEEKEKALLKLSPEKFKAFFKTFGAEKGWDGIACPV